MTAFDAFFADIDGRWGETPTTPVIPLRLIGSSALMPQEPRYQRGTKDSDVLETTDLTHEIKARLKSVAGRGSTFHDKHRMYLEIVPSGIPFLPQRPLWHPWRGAAALRHFEVHVLDTVDVVVSKLIRFNADDQSDIEAMIDHGRVLPERLIERFRAAVEFLLGDAAEMSLPACVENLNRVERDMSGVPETLIELPSWL